MAQRESTTRSAVQAMVGLVETRTDGTCAAACVVARSQIFFRALRFILHYRSLSLLTPPPQMHSLSLSTRLPLQRRATSWLCWRSLRVLPRASTIKLKSRRLALRPLMKTLATEVRYSSTAAYRWLQIVCAYASPLLSALCSLTPPPIPTHPHLRTPCTARDCSHLFTEIDELDANIDKLESVVEQLSEYSIHLEKRLQTATSAP